MAEETEHTEETPDAVEVGETPETQARSAEEATGSDQVAEEATDVVEEPEGGDLVADSPEPAAEAEPAAAAEEAVAAEPAPQSQPKKKRKRLPRAERPKKGRRVYTPATERRPIVRLPKPEQVRGRRQERRGVVVSSAMDKTIVVKVDMIKSHPKYKKVVRRSVKFHAHDEQNAANVGDVVRIVETRPLSKTKHWRLAEVLEVAK